MQIPYYLIIKTAYALIFGWIQLERLLDSVLAAETTPDIQETIKARALRLKRFYYSFSGLFYLVLVLELILVICDVKNKSDDVVWYILYIF